ncbi:MAG: glycosyltransferase family 2 protein [Solirubrobacteraceae bacterium]
MTANPSSPTFSVIIAAWNAAHLVGEAVESALAQTLPPMEVVVCDDDSEDDLSGALRPFGDRVTLLRIPHGGEGAAKNAAARHATGHFVAILDADDVYLPGRLQALAELARSRPDLDVLTTNSYLELEGRTIGTYYPTIASFPEDDQVAGIVEESSAIFGAAAVRRESLLAAGGFAVDMRTAADWELWMRLAIGGARFGLVDEPLHRYRLQPGSLTADKASEWRGCVEALEHVREQATTTGPEVRAAYERSLHKHREWAILAEAERSLRSGSPDARSRARAVAFGPGFAARTRMKALVAAAAPCAAARLLDRRERRTGVSRLSRRLPALL